MKLYRIITLGVLFFMFGASAQSKTVNSHPYNIVLPTSPDYVSEQYGNLDYGIRIQVRSDVRSNALVDLTELNSKEAATFPGARLDSSIEEATSQYLDQTASRLGFKVGSDSRTDFILIVTVKDLRLRVREYNAKKSIGSASAACVISWELRNADRDLVVSPSSCTGRDQTRNFASLMSPLGKSYAQALNGIEWDRVASALKVAKNARQEANKQVTGEGNTALEHTVIRWYIDSKPKGADVSWRVVSSTPDVSNSMSNYVGNTPYETTESFDIQGLTYNNSGNVQIEVTCERNGYIPQKKRFNLRQVIDQKEISAKFNLVKDDEE